MREIEPQYRRPSLVERTRRIILLTRQLREGFSTAMAVYSLISLYTFNRPDIALTQAVLTIAPILPEALIATVDTVRAAWNKMVRHENKVEILAEIERNWDPKKSIIPWAGDLFIGFGAGSFLGGNQIWQADLSDLPFPSAAPWALFGGIGLKFWGKGRRRK